MVYWANDGRFISKKAETKETPERCGRIYSLLAAFQSRHPTAQRENENLESNWRKATRRGRPGPEVWNPQGLKVLGTLDHEAAAQERSGDEEEFWRTIQWVPDLQCAWQLLVQCAGPHCCHFQLVTALFWEMF